MVYRFGALELDCALFELRLDGRDLGLRRRTFEVLRVLIEERHRVVGKEELLERVWQRKYVSESALANCISELRAALAGHAAARDWIRTVYGRGYRFVGEPDAAVAAGEPRAPESGDVFVGRAHELDQLGEALELALSSRAQVALLSGEAGIGKTATALRFAALARARGVRVVEATCSDGAAASIWPWTQVLRGILGGRAPDEVEALLGGSERELANLLPELAAACSTVADAAAADAPLFDAVARVLRCAAREVPLLVLFDDLHHADQTSLLLLEFLLAELRDARVLLLCTVQPPARALPTPLTRLLANLTRHPAARTVVLPALTRSDVELLVGLSGPPGRPDGFADRIFERTEGNPLFVSELLRLLEGRDAPAESCEALPPGLCATIALRLAHLGTECRDLLAVAAVIGRTFPVNLLQRASGLDAGACSDGLQEALDAWIVEELSGAPARFRFRHGLIRDAIWQGLAGGERAVLHRRVGEALEQIVGTTSDEHAAELAHHFAHAHERKALEKAVSYSVRAATVAAAKLAHDRAAEHYERAVALGEEIGLDPLRSCDLLLAFAGSLRLSAQYARADEVLSRAVARARSLGSTHRIAGAAVVWWGLDTFGSADAAWSELIEEALGSVEEEQELLRAWLLLDLVSARFAVDPPAENEARLCHVVEIGRRLGSRSLQALALTLLHGYVLGPELHGDREKALDEALALASSSRFEGARLLTSVTDLALRLEAGDPTGLAHARTGFERVASRERAMGLVARIAAALLAGDLASAEQSIESLWHDWLPCSVDGRLPLMLGCHVFVLRRDQGRLAELAPVLRRAAARGAGSTFWNVLRTLLLAETGREEAARAALEALGKDGFEDLPRGGLWLGNAACLAEACAAVGDARHAAPLYALLQPFAGRMALAGRFACVVPVSLCLGRLATLLGHFARAEAHLSAAQGESARLDAATFRLRTRLAEADLLSARGRRARARALREEATAEARDRGLHGLLSRAPASPPEA